MAKQERLVGTLVKHNFFAMTADPAFLLIRNREALLLVVRGFLTRLKAVLHSAILLLTTTVSHVLFALVPVYNL